LGAVHADLRKSKQEGLFSLQFPFQTLTNDHHTFPISIVGILYEIEVLRSDLNSLIRNLKSYARNEQLPVNLLQLDDRASVKRDPYGLVLVLGAWNYPIILSLQPVAGAIAAGNCVILKPSEVSPRCSAILAKLIPKYLDNVRQRIPIPTCWQPLHN